MTKTRGTKQALLMSVLALIMCVSMLVGSTMAWFTDSVTSTGNKIQAGTLKLDLELYNGTAYESIKESKAPIFNYDKWEPGYTDVKLLKIENNGTLALKWHAKFVSANAVTALADVIDVYVLPSEDELAMPGRDLTGYTKVGTVREFINTIETTTKGVLEGNSYAYLGIALKMQETAGNDYQGLTIGAFDIQILATQATVEEDIFNDQYDKDADFTIEVKNADELANALKAGGTVKLADDITADKAIEIPAGVEAVLDLNGNTLSGTAIKQQHTLINNGTLTIANGTIASVGDDGGSAINNKGTLTVVDTEINGAPFVGLPGGWYPSYAVNNTGTITITDSVITAEHGGVASTKGGVATLNNVDVTVGKNGITNAALYTASSGTIIVNGGTYTNRATDQSATGASVINGGVTVNAGTFNGRIENYYGTPVIKGGTFSANPTRFVSAAFEATNNGDGTWTVAPFKVSTGTELVNAIANGKAAELTQDVELGKIDLTGAINNDVVINANGHKITTTDYYGIEVTAGKNVTISNADVEMTKAGDYINYAAGFKIANGDYAGATITLENCKITMANTDWAYAVTMPASVKNLNLVINNCTLEGAVAVQCWGDNNTITITNSELICNYTTSALYTSYCVALQGDGSYNSENNTLVIDNCAFKYTGVDNFNSKIYSVDDLGIGNTVTVTNCTYGEKVVAE